MLAVLLLLVCIFINSVTASIRTKFDYFHHPVKSCHIGDVVQNDCNKCLCTSKTIFECTPVDCDRTKIEEPKSSADQICIPNQLYVQNLITCICTKDGKWPHKSCQETFLSLPPSNVVQHKCDPNSYVFIDCNVCRCGPDGEFISNRCTKNTCEDDISRRHHKSSSEKKKNSVYSNCEKKNWYSLAPCQFCYCVNENKLVCNTGNDISNKLELGTYDMQVCGSGMIKEALELVPESMNNLRDGINKEEFDVPPETTKLTAPETTTEKRSSKKKYSKVKSKKAMDMVKKQNTSNAAQAVKEVEEVDEKEVYYTDLEESNAKAPTTTAPVVQAPDIAMSQASVEENENSKSADESKGLEVEEHLAIPEKVPSKKHSSKKHKKPLRRTKMVKQRAQDNDAINLDLPHVFNKMFTMLSARKSLSLDKDTQCKPGTTTVNGCNTCFCLKNGKLLCSTNNC